MIVVGGGGEVVGVVMVVWGQGVLPKTLSVGVPTKRIGSTPKDQIT